MIICVESISALTEYPALSLSRSSIKVHIHFAPEDGAQSTRFVRTSHIVSPTWLAFETRTCLIMSSSSPSNAPLSASQLVHRIAQVKGALINGPPTATTAEQAKNLALRLDGALVRVTIHVFWLPTDVVLKNFLAASGVDEKEVFYAASAEFRDVLKRWNSEPWVLELTPRHPSWVEDPFYELEHLVGSTIVEPSSAQPSPAVSASALSDASSSSKSKRKRNTPVARGRQPKTRAATHSAPAASRTSSRSSRQPAPKAQATPEPSEEPMGVEDTTPKQDNKAAKKVIDNQLYEEYPEATEEQLVRLQEWKDMSYKDRTAAWRNLYVTPPAGAMVYARLEGDDMVRRL